MYPDQISDDTFQRAVMHAVEALSEAPYAGERLLKAADLVLTGNVTLTGNGYATVKSGSHTYELDPEEGCTCADSRNRSRHCKHAIAVELLKRAQALMQHGNGDASLPAPATLSERWQVHEAQASCCLKFTLSGLEVLYTMRDINDDLLFARVRRILPKIQEKVQVNGSAHTPEVPDIPRCPLHDVPMKRYSKGDQSWYSHQTPDGQWCRGR